jgi:hypothetical protein
MNDSKRDGIKEKAMANSEQVNGVKPFQVRAKSSAKDETDLISRRTPRMPHERDEAADSQSSGVRDDIKQAFDDVMEGQMDTDLREQRGVEASQPKTEEQRRANIVPPSDSPVRNPRDREH